jgi:hypothetical protein
MKHNIYEPVDVKKQQESKTSGSHREEYGICCRLGFAARSV